MAEARRQHWATAGTVLIEGATGSNSDIVNGAFEVAERPDNEPPIYRRADATPPSPKRLTQNIFVLIPC